MLGRGVVDDIIQMSVIKLLENARAHDTLYFFEVDDHAVILKLVSDGDHETVIMTMEMLTFTMIFRKKVRSGK